LIKITKYHGELNKIAGRQHMQYQDYIEIVPGKRSGSQRKQVTLEKLLNAIYDIEKATLNPEIWCIEVY